MKVFLKVLKVFLKVLRSQPFRNGIFVGFNESLHACLHTVLFPALYVQPHIGIVLERARQQTLRTAEVTLELTHIVDIAIAVATDAEDDRHRTVAP